MDGKKITHEPTIKLVNMFFICKWLNLKPDEVNSLPIEYYRKYSIIAESLENRKVL